MSTTPTGSADILFDSVGVIVDHYLPVILAKTEQKVGTEVEVFFVDHLGKALSLKTGQDVFRAFANELRDYAPEFMTEKDIYDKKKYVGLKIPTLGTITAEIGHQIEYSASVCDTIDQVLEKNLIFFEAARKVAKELGLAVFFQGYKEHYGATTKGSYRSRSQQWINYFNNRFKGNSIHVGEALTATASTQITLDAGGQNFHEYVQALMIIEPLLSLHFNNSKRAEVANRLPAAHMKPMIGVWGTTSPKEALTAIVHRLLDVEIPMHPDEYGQYHPMHLKSDGEPYTAKNQMDGGMLTERMLQNAGSFLFARPAFKNFMQGLIEMRGVDCLDSPKKIAELAERVTHIIYNDDTRRKLLADYSHFSKDDLLQLHSAEAKMGKVNALKLKIQGKSVKSMVDDLLDRSKPAFVPAWQASVIAAPAAHTP